MFLSHVHVGHMICICGPSLKSCERNSCITILCILNIRFLWRAALETHGLQSTTLSLKDRHIKHWIDGSLCQWFLQPHCTDSRQSVSSFLMGSDMKTTKNLETQWFVAECFKHFILCPSTWVTQLAYILINFGNLVTGENVEAMGFSGCLYQCLYRLTTALLKWRLGAWNIQELPILAASS